MGGGSTHLAGFAHWAGGRHGDASGSPALDATPAQGLSVGRKRWWAFAVVLVSLPAAFGFTLAFRPIPIRAVAPEALGLMLHQSQELPATPAGRVAEQWFAAMASGDVSELRSFFERQVSPGEDDSEVDQDVAMHQMVLRNTGGVLPHSVLRSDEHEIVLLAEGANGNWLRVTIGVRPLTPYQIILFRIRKSSGPESEALAVVTVSPALQQEVASAAGQLLRDQYVFEEVGIEYFDALADIVPTLDSPMSAEALGSMLTARLRAVSSDNHLAILDPARADRVLAMYGGPEDGNDEHHAEALEGDGFGRVESLSRDIAYVQIERFTAGPATRVRVEQVMESVQDAGAIVFDLRSNGGGDGEMVEQIESYLFAQPTHVMSSIRRGGPEEGRGIAETWTTTNDLSAKIALIPVFVLIDRGTGSAAEAFAFGLQHTGRATILGQTSAGAGHRVTYERLPGGFALGLPIGAAINPSTGRGWEGVGVMPDVEVGADTSLDELHRIVSELLLR